jgi:hypothetical protein
MTNFNEMTAKELVAAYNDMAKAMDDALVIRFSDRKAGIRRCEKLKARYDENFAAPAVEPVEKKVSKSRSAAIAASWTDSETAAKRAQRHAVRVAGQEFRSVRAAFVALNLPMSKHIKFRMELKAAGQLNAFGYDWEIIEA